MVTVNCQNPVLYPTFSTRTFDPGFGVNDPVKI